MHVPGQVHGEAEPHHATKVIARSSSAARRHGVRTLLFASSGPHESAALQHTEALAQSLHAELHVLRVVPPPRSFPAAVARRLGLKAAPREVDPCVEQRRLTARWCDDVLSAPLSRRRLAVRTGGFVSQVVQYARTLEDPVIVLPPSRRRLGSTATALAWASSRSVLVVRASARAATVLVATGLEKGATFCLQKARSLGRQLGAPVVALHNVTRIPSTVSVGSPLLAPLLLAPRPASDRAPLEAARVTQARERLAPMSTIVTNELDLVGAIIEQARRYRAHTVVVGTRRRSWFERFIEPSIAAAVVDGADRSVLVTPHRQD